MALRHPVPKFAWRQFGDGEGPVIRRTAAPVTVEFARGDAAIREFMQGVAKAREVIVKAAFMSGKSVVMPLELVRAGYELVVHVVPSRNLAGSTAAYVKSQNPSSVVEFVDLGQDTDVRQGLLLMSAAQYVWLISLWRSRGEVVNHVTYMDECHESDWVTATLRTLKSQVPGCTKFLMSSATHGHGGVGEEYRRPVLQSEVSAYHFDSQEPQAWDVLAPNNPWSVDEFTGNVLIYIDDEAAAETVREAYARVGCDVRRCTAHTPYVEFKAAIDAMNGLFYTQQFVVLILDYSYRNGFTFPGVTRIIDNCDVSFVRVEMNRRWVRTTRKAYFSEVMQTMYRGGRVAGTPCKYFRPSYEPDRCVVDLEGSEADCSAILFRVLGFQVPARLEGSPYAKGGLPSGFPELLLGDVPLRCTTDRRQPWADAVPLVDGAMGPAEAYDYSHDLPGDQPFASYAPGEKAYAALGKVRPADIALEKKRVAAGITVDRGLTPPPSVESSRRVSVCAGSESGEDGEKLRDGNPHVVEIDARCQVTRKGPVGVRKENLDEPQASRRRVGVEGEGMDAATFESDYRKLVGEDPRREREGRRTTMELMKYYYFPGAMPMAARYRDIRDVAAMWKADEAGLRLLRAADLNVRQDVASVALAAMNDASVVVNAVSYVTSRVAGGVEGSGLDKSAVCRWAEKMRGMYDAAVANFELARRYVRTLKGKEVVEVEPYVVREKDAVDEYMKWLMTSVMKKQIDVDEFREYRKETSDVPVRRMAAVTMSGRYSMDLRHGTVRERVAAKLLGGGDAHASVSFTEAEMERLRRRFEQRR